MKIHSSMFSTSTLLPLQLPSRMETHLWYVLPNEVNRESLLSRYVDLLSPLEKNHVFSIRDNQLQKTALIARALVRTTIARYQIRPQVSAKSLQFRKNTHGKPELDWERDNDWDPPPLHFNLSHTSSLIACGVTIDSPIGVDVEEKKRTMKNKILSFAKRYFTNEEMEEAYVKALGRGFSGAPFNTFTNHEDSEIEIVPLQNQSLLTTNWQFAQVDLAGSHYAAICRKTNGGEPMKIIVRKTIPLLEEEHYVDLAGSHYAAICRKTNGGVYLCLENVILQFTTGEPMKIIVRKTIPLLEEEHYVSNNDSTAPTADLT
nr:4'-phosphopantetheinyl transferase-like [Tanacetum cinerariifolium]